MNFPTTSNTIPVRADPIWTGRDIFISFLTPDNEVKVEEPVKFIARKEEIDVIVRNQADISMMSPPADLSKRRIRNTNEPE